MVALSMLPGWLRGRDAAQATPKTSRLGHQITTLLLSLSRRACSHPIHTLVFVGLLASTTYIGLLEGSLFGQQNGTSHAARLADWNTLLEGSKTLCIGSQTGWRWQLDHNDDCSKSDEVGRPRAVLLGGG